MTNTQRIVQAWKSYADTNDLRPGTQKYQHAQHAFINGCNALTGDQGLPPIIQIYVMCGRDIADIQNMATA